MNVTGLARQSAGYFAGRVLPALVTVLAVAAYTRLLEPSSVGLYATLSSIALFAAVAFYWVRVAMFRTLGSALILEPDFARTVVASFLVTAVIIGVVEAVALALFGRISPTLVGLTVVMTVANGWFELTATVLQSRREVAWYGALNLGRSITAVVCSLCLIAIGLRGEALLLGFALGNLTALASIRLWKPAARGAFDLALFGRLLHFGWPMTATGALSQVTVTFDRLILGATAGAAAVGIYAVAFDFSRQSVFLLISATALAGQPLAMHVLDHDGIVAAQRQLRQNARLMLGLAFPAVGGLLILASPIAHTLFGRHFQTGAELIIALVAAGTALYGLRTFYFDQAFELSRQTRPQAAISVLATAAAVVCSLILIPRYGAIGAAFSSLLSNALGISVSIVWGRRIFPLPFAGASWLQAGFATVGMLAILMVIPIGTGALRLALECGVAIATYGACYVVADRTSRVLSARGKNGVVLAKGSLKI